MNRAERDREHRKRIEEKSNLSEGFYMLDGRVVEIRIDMKLLRWMICDTYPKTGSRVPDTDRALDEDTKARLIRSWE